MEKSCLLNDRGVVAVVGADATRFLHRSVTNSMLDIPAGESRFAALLSAQGKLMFDFFVIPLPEAAGIGYFLEAPRALCADLVTRLNFHKLRAKIAIEDRSEAYAVGAVWGEAAKAPEGAMAVYRDMRSAGMGLRFIIPRDLAAGFGGADEAAYEAHRIAEGVPKGGADFNYGEAIVQDANLDWLNGVDFKKGCFIGQEVVARVYHRKSARKRIMKIHFDGPPPEAGAQVLAGETAIGQVGSVAGRDGLAMLRIDKLEDARTAGAPVTAGEAKVEIATQL